MGPADWVTLTRASIAAVVAALVSPARAGRVAGDASAIALVLDAVDGWVARRTWTTARGARFDGEVDAFLILVLSVYVARVAGAWVLAIGLARYVFLAAGWLLPWMRAPLPPRHWRKVVCATQGIVLTVAAADVLPPQLTRVALPSLSAARRVLRARRAVAVAPPATADPDAVAASALAVGSRSLALLLVWAALVAPHEPGRFTLGAFARLPLELLVLVALAARAARDRRAACWPSRGRAARRAGDREGPRHRVLHRVRPAVQPCRRLELRQHRHRDAARRDRQVAREPRHRRHDRARRRAPDRPGHGDAARDAGRGPPPRLGAASRRGLGVVWMVLRVFGAPAASAGAVALAADEVRRCASACRATRSSRARSPTTASARRPATGC